MWIKQLISVVMFLGDLLIEIMEEGRLTVAGLNTAVWGSFDNDDDGGLFEIIQCPTVWTLQNMSSTSFFLKVKTRYIIVEVRGHGGTAVDKLPSLSMLRVLWFYHWNKYLLKLFCSSFMGEYELEQRRFPRQHAAQSTKCSQYTRNVWCHTGLDNVCVLQVAWGGTMCRMLSEWKCHSGRSC